MQTTNRRTDSRSLTVLPLTGKSDSLRSYRLWSDFEGIAQSGQFAPSAANRPDISTVPSITVRLSKIRPGSRRLLSHAFGAIDVHSLLNPGGVGQTQRGNVKFARNLSQTQFCAPVDILVRDPDGKRDPQAFFSTDITLEPAEIIALYVRRWQIEVTFAETRAHLGVETQRQWTDKAIARTTPALLGLYSLISLWACDLLTIKSTTYSAACIEKPT